MNVERVLPRIATKLTAVPPKLLLVGLLLLISLVVGADPVAAEEYCWDPTKPETCGS